MTDKDPRDENDAPDWNFDETNGVVSGLEGESGGTAEGENYSAGDPEEPERNGLGAFLRHPFRSVMGQDDRGQGAP